MSADLAPLNAAEIATLAECEATIQNGLRTFVDVGRSLARIRDGRLYRQTHTTFEAYCEQEYALSRPRAYQLIDAAKITEAMSTNVDTPAPATESQARELSGLDPETAAQVMRSAAESEQRVTAAAIARSREQIAPKPEPAPSRFTKVHHEAMVDKETGEVVDTYTTTPPTTAPEPSPLAVADAAMRQSRNSPWSVFTAEIMPAINRAVEWAENKGAAVIVADRVTANLPAPADEFARQLAALDRIQAWATSMRTEITAQSRPLRSVQ